jgi:hypothetical protein
VIDKVQGTMPLKLFMPCEHTLVVLGTYAAQNMCTM